MGKKSQKRIVLYIYKYIHVFPIRRTFFDSSNSCFFLVDELFFSHLISWNNSDNNNMCVCKRRKKYYSQMEKNIYLSMMEIIAKENESKNICIFLKWFHVYDFLCSCLYEMEMKL